MVFLEIPNVPLRTVFAETVTYVTGFWKTNKIVTLGLFILLAQLMATFIHNTYTVTLPGLIDWCAFLERVLLLL